MNIMIGKPVPGYYYCVDDDTYDGAPDTEGESSLIGSGDSKYNAFMDWAEQYASLKYAS